MGLSVAAAPKSGDVDPTEGSVVFEQLGVAVVDAPPDALREATVADDGSSAIVAIEPERVVRAIEVPQDPGGLPTGLSPEYLRGYRDAIVHLTDGLAAGARMLEPAITPAAAFDESQATWGVQAVRAVNSCRAGRGVRIAVLDTGFDLRHPDFVGRTVVGRSVIAGQEVQDGHGHGHIASAPRPARSARRAARATASPPRPRSTRARS